MSHLWYHPIRIAVSFTYITHGLYASVFLQNPQNKHKLTLFSSHWIQRNGGSELRKFKCLAQNLTSTIWMKEFRAQKLLLDLKCLLSLGKPAFPILFQILLTHTHVCVSKIPVYAICWFLFFLIRCILCLLFLQEPLPVFDFWIIWRWSIYTDLVQPLIARTLTKGHLTSGLLQTGKIWDYKLKLVNRGYETHWKGVLTNSMWSLLSVVLI